MANFHSFERLFLNGATKPTRGTSHEERNAINPSAFIPIPGKTNHLGDHDELKDIVQDIVGVLVGDKEKRTRFQRPTSLTHPSTISAVSSFGVTLTESNISGTIAAEEEIQEIPRLPESSVTAVGETDDYIVDFQSNTASTTPSTPDVGNTGLSQRLSHFLTPSSSDILESKSNEQIERDLIIPVRPLSVYIPAERAPLSPSHRPESPETGTTSSPTISAIYAPAPTTTHASEAGHRWWKTILRRKKAAIEKPIMKMVPADQSSVILPSPPTDSEKTIYAKTRRGPLYIFGTFSFLSVSAGMWLFAISSKMFYWFSLFVGLLQIYLIISFTVGYAGKDFDLEKHKEVLENHSYLPDKPPSVDIYLPCCHEPIEVLENTYKHISQLQYPNFKVWVLDDGGLHIVKNLAERYGFNYITRNNKPYLKKAGNLRYAFARTNGEFFVIFDADFCPRSDFLDVMLPYMNAYPDTAIVQSPQFFRPCAEQTWVEQGASATQELFYRVVQVNRDRWGASICVGSNALYRRAALEEVGGTAEIGHSEDVHTGFYALTRGWKLRYLPLALACGVSPDTPRAFFSQQMRWCAGSTTLLIYSVVVFRLWSRQRYNVNVNFVFVIQQFAYLMAIKDRIFGTTASWVPSGDNNSHGKTKNRKGGNNKYHNMRILCAVWMFGTTVALIVGVTLRILEGYVWYNFLPLVLLDGFNLFVTHKFIFFSK